MTDAALVSQLDDIRRQLDNTETLRRIEGVVIETRRDVERVKETVDNLKVKIEGSGDGISGLTGRVTALEHAAKAGADNKRANIAIIVAAISALATLGVGVLSYLSKAG